MNSLKVTKARASTLILPHGPVSMPIFQPVATQASLKGLTPSQLAQTGCKLCLNNTYHLGLKPGQETLEAIGGAHKLQGWDGNILTDSGGYGRASLRAYSTDDQKLSDGFPTRFGDCDRRGSEVSKPP